jgi:hypothetical protein
MTMGRYKRDDEGKKEQNKGQAEKKSLMGNRSLKSRVHRHTLLEECVGKIVLLSFNLQQIPNTSE